MTTDNKNIIKKELDQAMAPRYSEYALYTISDRALPDVKSGCKPVSSRILYTMHEMGLKSNSVKKKCARICGQVVGLRHPHSPTSVYGNLVNMSQDWRMRYPLIDFQGK